jgi:ABC-2 type transport system permease protein
MKEILVAPISRTSIMLGKTLGGAATAVFEAFLVLIVAILLTFIPLPSITSFVIMLGIMFLTSCGLVALGLVIATRLENMEGFNLIMSFIVMPMFLLSGAIFPITNLPAPLASVVLLDPMTYGVDALRNVLVGTSTFPLFVSVGTMGIFSAAMVLLGALSFRKMV